MLSSKVDSASKPDPTRYFSEGNLQEFAERSRKASRFNDIRIKSGNVCLLAHRLVLACCSPFFERLFQAETQERYHDIVELNDLNEGSLEILVKFMYTRNITIETKNVLATAHYLEMNDICDFCFDFLKTAITTDNWSKVLSACLMYDNDLILEQLSSFISKKFSDITHSEIFKNITFQEMKFITKNANRSIVEEKSLYEAMQSWISHDEVNRISKFSELFFTLRYLELPDAVLVEIVSDPRNRNICQLIVQTAPLRKAIFRAKMENKIFTRLRDTLFESLPFSSSTNFDYDAVTPSTDLLYDAKSFSTSGDDADVVGIGGYGVVRRCVHSSLGQVVVKCMHCESKTDLDLKLAQTHKRVHVFSRFNHEFIVRFHGMTSWDSCFGMIMEEVQCGNLEDLMIGSQEIKTIDWKLRFRILFQLASAINYLHYHDPNKAYVHLDIKPENILMTKKLDVKLADFGALDIVLATDAKPTTDISGANQYTLCYTAPERLQDVWCDVSRSMDVYSF